MVPIMLLIQMCVRPIDPFRNCAARGRNNNTIEIHISRPKWALVLVHSSEWVRRLSSTKSLFPVRHTPRMRCTSGFRSVFESSHNCTIICTCRLREIQWSCSFDVFMSYLWLQHDRCHQWFSAFKISTANQFISATSRQVQLSAPALA